MWSLSVPWWEFVLRAVVVYAFVLILLRISGKRQVGQLSPFDLVLLLLLSNSVQNAMNAGDNSLLGGLVSAAVLVALNYGVGVMTFRSKKLESIIDGRPQVLIHRGKVDDEVMRKVQLTHHELESALRREGCMSVLEVKFAILETNGDISVIKRDAGDELPKHPEKS